MINGKTVLGIIPARGGSKSLPEKNIQLLAGKPLIAWTIDEARNSSYLDRVILSSDSEKIIETARTCCNCDVPFIRPDELARDDTPGIDPILHAINEIPGFDLVVMLQPTSPLRKAADIDACIEICESDGVNSCISVTTAEKSPYWMYSVEESGEMTALLPQPDGFYSRQTLPQAYALNGAVYAAKTDWLVKQGSFFSSDTRAYIMPRERSIDVDTDLDLSLCEILLERE